MGAWYIGPGDPRQPLASPVFADLTGLPPILCLVGGDEVLLDDSIRMAYNAGMAGLDVTLFIRGGVSSACCTLGTKGSVCTLMSIASFLPAG